MAELRCFNPRLPLPGGDAPGLKAYWENTVVSIHASRCREAMPASFTHTGSDFPFQSTPPVAGRRCHIGRRACGDFCCFNPRLPLPGGDARRLPGRNGGRRVSIHASRCREAMPAEMRDDILGEVFQSTPPVAGRRCAAWSGKAKVSKGFNPRLPLPGGDAYLRRPAARVPIGFNPRLPLPGGDA